MKPVRRTSDLVIQELDGEVLIYDLRQDKALCLNKTAARIWQLCDGSRTVDSIALELEARPWDSTVEGHAVRLGLRMLHDEELVDLGPSGADGLTQLSRRELAKRAGLASTVLLPLVSSLMVPSAAAAQSVACSGNPGTNCRCTRKVVNFSAPCPSNGCSGNCQCSPPFIRCNAGGNQCVGTCA